MAALVVWCGVRVVVVPPFSFPFHTRILSKKETWASRHICVSSPSCRCWACGGGGGAIAAAVVVVGPDAPDDADVVVVGVDVITRQQTIR